MKVSGAVRFCWRTEFVGNGVSQSFCGRFSRYETSVDRRTIFLLVERNEHDSVDDRFRPTARDLPTPCLRDLLESRTTRATISACHESRAYRSLLLAARPRGRPPAKSWSRSAEAAVRSLCAKASSGPRV